MTETKQTSMPDHLVRRGKRVPYVNFERTFKSQEVGKPEKEITDIWQFDLTGHAHAEKVEYYAKKGMKVVGFWLPGMETEVSNPKWGYKDVHEALTFLTGGAKRIVELEAHAAALEERVKKYEQERITKKN